MTVQEFPASTPEDAIQIAVTRIPDLWKYETEFKWNDRTKQWILKVYSAINAKE